MIRNEILAMDTASYSYTTPMSSGGVLVYCSGERNAS